MWPENWSVWQFYCLCSTQWTVGGMGGRVALNYVSCFAVMDEIGVPADERRPLFMDLRVIEGAVLEQQAEDAKQD